MINGNGTDTTFLSESSASAPAPPPSKTSTKEIGKDPASPTNPNVCISPSSFTEFPISKKTQTSHNTAVYRFKLPTEQSILGLPIGQHISLAAELQVLDPKDNIVKPKEVVRSYTPISSDVHPGYFDLLIKSYPTGLLSRHFASLKEGDTMKVRGPKGQMVYTPNMVRRFGMIAGGTGITPMLQVAQAIRRGRKTGDKTQVDLIFANVNEEDILLREDLDDLNKEDGFNVYYVLNNPPEGWTGGVGFVTADMIKVCLVTEYCPECANTCHRNVFHLQQRTSRFCFADLHLWLLPSRRPPSLWAMKRLELLASWRTRSLLSRLCCANDQGFGHRF